MRGLLLKATRNRPREDTTPTVSNEDNGPESGAPAPAQLLLNLAPQSLWAASIEGQCRSYRPEADTAQPCPQWPQVPVVGEESWKNERKTAISARHADAIVERIGEELS